MVSEVYYAAETGVFSPLENKDFQLIIRPRNPLMQTAAELQINSEQLENLDFPSLAPILPVSLSKKIETAKASPAELVVLGFSLLLIAFICYWGSSALIGTLLSIRLS